MNSFDIAAQSYTEGSIDFSTFVKSTSAGRAAMTSHLLRKMSPVPTWYGIEDAEQDYLMAIHHAATQYDNTKMKAGAYLRVSLTVVKKHIHRAKGVDSHTRKGPPQFERTFSSLGLETAPERGSDYFDYSENKRREYYSVLNALCTNDIELAVLYVLERCEGDLESAASELYNEPRRRDICRVRSELSAKLLINRVVNDLIAKYGKKPKAINETKNTSNSSGCESKQGRRKVAVSCTEESSQ